ncbi:DUF2946 family protein [Roseibium sp. RKSG952]|uniref:DUF2946 family protein n=1 Tax=Roseibium sp. RKSG952 TaxID=2529384 RepID=UPI0012BB8D49|nr:DUF2946 family protein [Roseibium sp. RKSG952]MTI00027.1 hypothetical protein [Roseibium sp. RKSG952]
MRELKSRSGRKRQIARKANWAKVVLRLLLLPYVLISLIPAGYMPDVADDGQISITICTTNGLQTLFLNEDGTFDHGSPGGEEEPRTADALCAFSALYHVAVLQPDDPVPHVTAVKTRISAAKSDTGVHLRRFPPLGARAPPVSI